MAGYGSLGLGVVWRGAVRLGMVGQGRAISLGRLRMWRWYGIMVPESEWSKFVRILIRVLRMLAALLDKEWPSGRK